MTLVRIVIALLAVFVVSIPVASAQEDSPDFQQVTVTYSEDGIDVSPAEIPAGMTTLVLENTSDMILGGPFGRFKDGNTAEDFFAAAGGGSFEALLLLDVYGGVPIMPHASQSVIADLEAGEYFFIANGSGGAPLTGQMTVTPSEAAEATAPEHDVNVVMVDFAYGTPSTIEAGEQVWRIRNEGEQMHEMFVVPVAPGTTLAAATEIIRSIRTPFAVLDGSAPVDVALLFGPVSPGIEVWTPVTLAPGTYAIGGLLPDYAELDHDCHQVLQLDHGMIRIITVE